MGNEEVPPGAGAGLGSTPPGGPVDGPAPSSPTHDTVVAEPATTQPAAGVLEVVRTGFAGTTSRKALGWVLFVGWAVWLVAVWVAQPRLVPQDFLAGDLAQGRITGYRFVTIDENRTRGILSGPYDLEVHPASGPVSEAGDSDADGRQVTIAYWVDAPVAGLRVLDPEASPSGTPAVLASLRSADVPEAPASLLYRDTWAQRIHNAGALLLLASTLVIVLGPRPRRGTRWFWFWVTGVPFAVGVPVFAVVELLRARPGAPDAVYPPGVAGRWSGSAGFWLGLLVSLAGGLVITTFTGLSPIWFIRG